MPYREDEPPCVPNGVENASRRTFEEHSRWHRGMYTKYRKRSSEAEVEAAARNGLRDLGLSCMQQLNRPAKDDRRDGATVRSGCTPPSSSRQGERSGRR